MYDIIHAGVMSAKLRHRPLIEEEDASALKLGPEFNNAGCLLISEVKYLLENRDKDAPDTAWVFTSYNPFLYLK